MLHNILLIDWSNDKCDGCRMSCAECAVCALDGARVEAYANSYHGDSWAKKRPATTNQTTLWATLWATKLEVLWPLRSATKQIFNTR